MTKLEFLPESRKLLNELTTATFNAQTATIANAIWEKHLQPDNPLWNYISSKPFLIKTKAGSAHVIAMVDKRLSGMGLLGYFGCTDSAVGSKVLQQASMWLYEQCGVKDIYGPINGTATSDYRLNLDDDHWFPGEPVNPPSHIEAFAMAGYSPFNHYVSGMAKHYRLLANLFTRMPKQQKSITIRPFNVQDQLGDLKTFHELMTAIFPSLSIYCPKLSWEERQYNFRGKDPLFNPRYTYFLELEHLPIGLIVAFPYDTRLIIKTIGILPDYRGRHLSNLLVRKVYEVAAEDNLKAAIYAMVRTGNEVYKAKRPGVKMIRHYVTMKKSF